MVKKSIVVSAFVLPCLLGMSAAAAALDHAGPGAAGPAVEAAQSVAEQSAPAPTGVVNVNTATAAQLQLLPGIGPSRAQAIIEYRERHPFRRPEDLLAIRGIGRATLNRMLPYVVVQGETTLTRPVPGAPRPPRGR